MAHAVRSWLMYRLPERRVAGDRLATQCPLPTALPLSAASVEHVAEALQSAGVRYELSRQRSVRPASGRRLAEVVGVPARVYPPNVGLRVVSLNTPRGGTVSDAAREAAIVGNFLHARGLGPRIYDILAEAPAATVARPGRGVAAFAVEHVGDEPPADEPRALSVRAIETHIDAGELATANGTGPGSTPRASGAMPPTRSPAGSSAFERLREPHRHDHLKAILERGAREHLHFGRQLAFRRGQFLYQSVPTIGATGRRDSLGRWELISLSARGKRRLAEGSPGARHRMQRRHDARRRTRRWGDLGIGVGTDPEVIAQARQLLGAMGYTRFDLAGGDLASRLSAARACSHETSATPRRIYRALSRRPPSRGIPLCPR